MMTLLVNFLGGGRIKVCRLGLSANDFVTKIPSPKHDFVQSANLQKLFSMHCLEKRYVKFTNLLKFHNTVLHYNNIIINNRKNRVQKAILNLEHDIKYLKKVTKKNVESILDDISKGGGVNGSRVEKYLGILLLQCCGDLMPNVLPSSRVQLAHRIWDTLKDRGYQFTQDHYKELLKCYVENQHEVSPLKFVGDMSSVRPDEMTYLLLLQCVCEKGRLDLATQVVGLMKKEGLPASAAMFNVLLLGHAKARDMQSALGILELMESLHLEPNSTTYTSLMHGFATLGDVSGLRETFQKATAARIFLSEQQFLSIVKCLVMAGNESLLPEMLKWFPTMSSDGGINVKNCAIHLVHLGKGQAAFMLAEKLLPATGGQNEDFGKCLLQEMVLTDTPMANIVQLCDERLSMEHGLQALLHVAEACLVAGNVASGLVALQALKDRKLSLRPHYFWPLLVASSHQRGEPGVLDTLRHMMGLGVQPDFETLVHYVLPHISLLEPEVAVRKLQDLGLTVRMSLFPVLAVLLCQGQLAAACNLCDLFKIHLESDKLTQPLVSAYHSAKDVTMLVPLLRAMASGDHSDWTGQFLLEVLASKNAKLDLQKLWSVIKMFQEALLKISSFAGEVLCHNLAHAPDVRDSPQQVKEIIDSMIDPHLNITVTEMFSQHILHPQQMDVEELECHLVELRAKGLNTRGVLRKLLQAHCRHGNVERVISIRQECEELGYEMSPGMIASVFDVLVRSGQLEEAESLFEKLTYTAPDFVLDEHKIVDFATLLVSRHKYKTALAVLEGLAKRQPVKGGAAISRNCWRLLGAVAETTGPGKTKAMLELLVRLGYCGFTNTLLGPVVRAHLLRDDLAGAVEEFCSSAAVHGTTPLQHELLCRLAVRPETHGMLHAVLDAGVKVHGVASTRVALIVALAEVGLVKQLQQLLQDSSVKIDYAILMTRCKRFVNENKLEALQNIIVACKAISSLNISPIYTLMMKILSRRGDCESALALWTTMQDTNVQPSPQFLNLLAAMLRSHNQPVPFAVPMDDQGSMNHRIT